MKISLLFNLEIQQVLKLNTFVITGFMMKNNTPEDQKILIYFATAYNKFGENNSWHQENVERFFSKDELLIGKDYWNFVCNDENGFDIVLDQYKISSQYIKDSLTRIRKKMDVRYKHLLVSFLIKKECNYLLRQLHSRKFVLIIYVF